MGLAFDKIDQIITVESPATEITMQELINGIRDFEDEYYGVDIAKVANASGKEALGGGVLVGITVTLIDWKLKFADRAGPDYILCNATGGNLVTFDTGSQLYINPIEPAAYVTVVITASSSATLQELEAIQYSSFDGAVHIDVLNGVSGTEFPVGTPQSPVDNLTDAQLIAVERGFGALHIHGDIEFTSGDNIDEYEIWGEGHELSTITFSGTVSNDSTILKDATITGGLNGDHVHIYTSHIDNITGFSGMMVNCLLVGNITLDGTDDCHLINCVSAVLGAGTPVIDMGGSGRGLALRAYAGGVKLINKTGSESVSVDFISGQLKIASTVTDGEIIVRGAGWISEPFQTGTTVIRDDGLINPDVIWDEILTAGTHNIPTSAGRRLRSIEDAVEASVDDPSPTTSGFITTLTSAVDGFYVNQTIHFLEGDLEGSTRIVDTYTGSTKRVTFDEPWTSVPADGDDFHIHATHLHTVDDISDAVWDEPYADHQAVGTFGAFLLATLGLSGENTKWSSLSHDAYNNLTGATITVYTDDTLVTPIKSWTLTATYNANSELTAYQMVEN